MPSLCTTIQDAVTRRLAPLGADGVAVHGLLRGDMVSVVAAVVQQLGIGVQVLPALPTGINGNISGPWVDAMQFTIRVVEQPLLNKLPLTRWDVMERIIVSLEGWQPDVPECNVCSLDRDVTETLSPDGYIELEINGRIPGPLTATAIPAALPATALTPIDTPILKRGTAAVPAGVATLAIAFDAPFQEPPRVQLVTVINPLAGPAWSASIATATAEGLTVTLAPVAGGGGVTPSADYQVVWLAVL